MPITKSRNPWNLGVENLGRIGDAFFHFTPEISAYIVNIYGYPDSGRHEDRLVRNDQLFLWALERAAMAPRGPQIICGDFNMDTQQSEVVRKAKAQGWVDAQEWYSQLLGQPCRPTCKEATRPDCIFVNRFAFRGLLECRPVDFHSFGDQLPVVAWFKWPNSLKFRKVWDITKGTNSEVAFVLHDAIVVDLSLSDRPLLEKMMNAMAQSRYGQYGVNVSIGKNYGDMRKTKLGL